MCRPTGWGGEAGGGGSPTRRGGTSKGNLRPRAARLRHAPRNAAAGKTCPLQSPRSAAACGGGRGAGGGARSEASPAQQSKAGLRGAPPAPTPLSPPLTLAGSHTPTPGPSRTTWRPWGARVGWGRAGRCAGALCWAAGGGGEAAGGSGGKCKSGTGAAPAASAPQQRLHSTLKLPAAHLSSLLPRHRARALGAHPGRATDRWAHLRPLDHARPASPVGRRPCRPPPARGWGASSRDAAPAGRAGPRASSRGWLPAPGRAAASPAAEWAAWPAARAAWGARR